MRAAPDPLPGRKKSAAHLVSEDASREEPACLFRLGCVSCKKGPGCLRGPEHKLSVMQDGLRMPEIPGDATGAQRTL